MYLPAELRTVLIILCLSPLLSGCDPLAPMAPVPVSGAFELHQINGDPLPVMVDARTGQMEIVEGRLQLGRNGRYMQTLLARLPDGTPADLRDSGTFGGEGTAIEFKPDERNRSGFTGTLSGDTLTTSGSPFLISEDGSVHLLFVPEGR